MTNYRVWDVANEEPDDGDLTIERLRELGLGETIRATSPSEAATSYATHDVDSHDTGAHWSLMVIDCSTGKRHAFEVATSAEYTVTYTAREIDP